MSEIYAVDPSTWACVILHNAVKDKERRTRNDFGLRAFPGCVLFLLVTERTSASPLRMSNEAKGVCSHGPPAVIGFKSSVPILAHRSIV